MRSIKLILLQLAMILGFCQMITGFLLIQMLPQANRFVFIMTDTMLLMLVASPIIYWRVIRSYIRINDKLAHQMLTFDQITNLGNRRHLYDQLKHLIAYNSRHRIYGAVLLIDIDNFHQISEQHGRESLNAILVMTAKRLVETTRKEDVVCHSGGSEFYVLLSRMTDEQPKSHALARETSKRILAALQKPLQFHKKALEIQPCIGIQLISPEVTSVRRILNDLDIALYKAKRSGPPPIAFA